MGTTLPTPTSSRVFRREALFYNNHRRPSNQQSSLHRHHPTLHLQWREGHCAHLLCPWLCQRLRLGGGMSSHLPLRAPTVAITCSRLSSHSGGLIKSG